MGFLGNQINFFKKDRLKSFDNINRLARNLFIEAPNIIHTNTLSENLADVQEKDRFDVILANPTFGGKERKEVQQNFPIRTGETVRDVVDKQNLPVPH